MRRVIVGLAVGVFVAAALRHVQARPASQSLPYRVVLPAGLKDAGFALAPTAIKSPTVTPTPNALQTSVAGTFTAIATLATQTPTVDDVGTAVAGTMTASVPTPTVPTPTPTLTRTRTATPTRTAAPIIPSETPRPTQPRCVEKIVNGSFETSNPTGWTQFLGRPGDTAIVDESQAFLRPYSGLYMARMRPESNEFTDLWSTKFERGDYSQIDTATLTYAWQGRTSDTLDLRDTYLVQIIGPNYPGESGHLVTGHFNDDVVSRWTVDTFDVKPAFAKGWATMQLLFAAKNDISLDTTWYTDAVSLQVCRK